MIGPYASIVNPPGLDVVGMTFDPNWMPTS
jgi:hypothetical protein